MSKGRPRGVKLTLVGWARDQFESTSPAHELSKKSTKAEKRKLRNKERNRKRREHKSMMADPLCPTPMKIKFPSEDSAWMQVNRILDAPPSLKPYHCGTHPLRDHWHIGHHH